MIKTATRMIRERRSREVVEARPIVKCLAEPVTVEYDGGKLMTEAELRCTKRVDVEPKTSLGLKLRTRHKYAASSKRLFADALEKQPTGLQKKTYNRSQGVPALTGIRENPLAGSGEHPSTGTLK